MDDLYQFRTECRRQRRREQSITVSMFLLGWIAIPVGILVMWLGISFMYLWSLGFRVVAHVLRWFQPQEKQSTSLYDRPTLAIAIDVLELCAYNIRVRFVEAWGLPHTIATESDALPTRGNAVARRRSLLRRFLDGAVWFVPREVREPFWNHVLEDCARMRDDGRSECFVACATVSQSVILVIASVKELLLEILSRALARVLRGD